MPLSRAFLSLGISSELPLFCSVIPTPQAQVAVRPAPAWQRDGHWRGRVLRERQWWISLLHGTSEVCLLSLGGTRGVTKEKLKESLLGCAFIN